MPARPTYVGPTIGRGVARAGPVVTPVSAPDTGAVRSDLRAYVGELVERYGGGKASDVLPHLLEASCYDEQLRVSLEAYLRNRQTTVRTIIGRGIERGELGADVDVDLLVDLVLGPFFYRRLLTRKLAPAARVAIEAALERTIKSRFVALTRRQRLP